MQVDGCALAGLETLGGEANLIHPLSDTQSENIGANCFIENDVRIGDGVTIKNGVQVWDRIVIEDGAFVGPNATFTNDLMPRCRRGAKAREPEFSLVCGNPAPVQGRVNDNGEIVDRRNNRT